MNQDTHKPTRAVALRYSGSGAPRATVKADGLLVERMLELAREHGVQCHRDPQLVGMLAQVKLGAEIPPALYAAVAAVLAMVYAVAEKAARKTNENISGA